MIVLFVVTRNEAELLRLNLTHHLGWGFGHVAVADNESTDATQDVLREFGDAITMTRIRDPNDRFLALSKLLHQIEERHGVADWVGVSDTDEFWWTPEMDLRSLLARVADRIVAVNSDQKFFLPTELDPVAGPVYCRRKFRTSGVNSPLHTSYIAGKSLYRGSWVRDHGITNPHWSEDIPHGLWRFKRPLVHHYMIDSEDSFVEKVKSLERWSPQVRALSEAGTAPQDQPLLQQQPVRFRAFKTEWWRLYAAQGEAGLRDYYRRKYVISAGDVPHRLNRGELVEDSEFANFKRTIP